MDVLNTIWSYILPIGGGITVGAVIVAIATVLLRAMTTRALSKLDVDKIEEKAVNRGVERVKAISFKQSIQPLVESELKKVTETANDHTDKKLREVEKRLDTVINILSGLAAYFDNSIGVPEDAKEKLHNTILAAKKADFSEQEFFVVENTAEKENAEKQADFSPVVGIER